MAGHQKMLLSFFSSPFSCTSAVSAKLLFFVALTSLDSFFSFHSLLVFKDFQSIRRSSSLRNLKEILPLISDGNFNAASR